VLPIDPNPDHPHPLWDELVMLVEQARGGDPIAVGQLGGFLDANPDLVEHVGDLAVQVERAWIALAAGADPFAQEVVERKLARLKARHAGPAPTPLEQLLVAHLAAAWLQVAHGDALAAQVADKSDAQARFVLQRQERAQKRYLAAAKALAVVRKLQPERSAPGPQPDDGDPVLALRRQVRAGCATGICLSTSWDQPE
jgi:hypothetical protein